MIAILVIVTLILVGGTVSVPVDVLQNTEGSSSRLFEDQIREALEEFRGVMLTGNEELPVLDPLQVEEVHFQMEDIGAQGTCHAIGVVVENMSTFVANNVQFALLARRLTIDISVKELLVFADYVDFDGSALGQEISAVGHGMLTLLDTGISGTMRVRIPLFGPMQVFDVQLKVYLSSVRSDLEAYNAGEDDDDINEVLEQLLPAFVQLHEKELSDFLNPLVEGAVNDYLNS